MKIPLIIGRVIRSYSLLVGIIVVLSSQGCFHQALRNSGDEQKASRGDRKLIASNKIQTPSWMGQQGMRRENSQNEFTLVTCRNNLEDISTGLHQCRIYALENFCRRLAFFLTRSSGGGSQLGGDFNQKLANPRAIEKAYAVVSRYLKGFLEINDIFYRVWWKKGFRKRISVEICFLTSLSKQHWLNFINQNEGLLRSFNCCGRYPQSGSVENLSEDL